MASNLDLSGVYVPLITPFTADDRVDTQALAGLANHYLDAGAHGLIALGTTGEPATLEAAEKSAVIELVGSIARERGAQFAVGVGTNSTKATVDAVREVSAIASVDAILTVVPYYTRPSEDGIVEHYRAVAEASSVPIIAYNIPYRTGRGLGADSLIEIAAIDNMAGLKQAVGGIDADTLILMANKPDGFHVTCGDDAFIFSLMSLGGTGAIAASSHVCTDAFVSMIDAALREDFTTAKRINDVLLPVCQTLFTEPSPAVIKAVLADQGLIATANLRLPMLPASVRASERAIAVVKSAQQQLLAI